MGNAWILETALDRSADADHLRAPAAPAPKYERCLVEGCGWEGTDGVSLADHMAHVHPVDLPVLLLDGLPARASQYLRTTPNDHTFAVVGDAVLRYQVDASPWRVARTTAELGAAMASSPAASDWTVSLQSSAHQDLRIGYEIRLRVLSDDDRRHVDDGFLAHFRHSNVSVADVLAFRSAWDENLLQKDYAGVLADCMQWLVARGVTDSPHQLGDAGPYMRRLARYDASVTAAMIRDVLRFCEMDTHERATQTALPSVTFALDWLHGIAVRGKAGAPDVSALCADQDAAATIFIDGATQELLDRAVDLAREDDLHQRAALAADLVAWSSAGERLPVDREKALVFAVAGAPAGTPGRSRWARALVHRSDVGAWARGIVENEGGA